MCKDCEKVMEKTMKKDSKKSTIRKIYKDIHKNILAFFTEYTHIKKMIFNQLKSRFYTQSTPTITTIIFKYR